MNEKRRVTKIDYNGSRIETGSLQIGDDWPGVFIRGDAAAYYSMMIESFLEDRENALAELQVRRLAKILGGVVVDTYNDNQDRESRFAAKVAEELALQRSAQELYGLIEDFASLVSTLADTSISSRIRCNVLSLLIDQDREDIYVFLPAETIESIGYETTNSSDHMTILWLLNLSDDRAAFDRMWNHVDEETRQWYSRAHKT